MRADSDRARAVSGVGGWVLEVPEPPWDRSGKGAGCWKSWSSHRWVRARGGGWRSRSPQGWVCAGGRHTQSPPVQITGQQASNEAAAASWGKTICRSVDSESRGRTHQPSDCSSNMEGNPLGLAPQLWRVGVGGKARGPTCTRDRDVGSSEGNSPRGEAPRRARVHTAWPPGPSAQQTLLGAWGSALCLGCRRPAIEVRRGEPRDGIRACRGDPRACALSARGQ